MEQPELEQDIDLMPYYKQVDPPASPDPKAEKVQSDQGDIEILGDNPEGEKHNISFDKLQHRVVKSHRVSSLDGNTSPMDFEE